MIYLEKQNVCINPEEITYIEGIINSVTHEQEIRVDLIGGETVILSGFTVKEFHEILENHKYTGSTPPRPIPHKNIIP